MGTRGGVSLGLQDAVTLCREEVSDFRDAPEGVLGGDHLPGVSGRPAVPDAACAGLGGPTARSRPRLWEAGVTADSQWDK